MTDAMIELCCDSFDQVPRRFLLDIDDTLGRVQAGPSDHCRAVIMLQLATTASDTPRRCPFLPAYRPLPSR